MADTIDIGFIGCGGNAQWHMGTLKQLGAVRVVAVCDLVESAARQAAELTGGECYINRSA